VVRRSDDSIATQALDWTHITRPQRKGVLGTHGSEICGRNMESRLPIGLEEYGGSGAGWRRLVRTVWSDSS